MFISIPKEFFVPVVFGKGFILNEENEHLELDTGMYRESTEIKKNTIKDKVIYTGEGKSLKEKKDSITVEEIKPIVEEVKPIVKEVKPIVKEEKKIEEKPIYVPLKKQIDCKKDVNIFEELDDEYIACVSGKQCNKEK